MAEIQFYSNAQDLINEPSMLQYALGKVKHWDQGDNLGKFKFNIYTSPRKSTLDSHPDWLEWQLSIFDAQDENRCIISIALIQRSKTSELESHS